jgi:hypothetical protein
MQSNKLIATQIHAMVQQYIWAEVAKLDSTVCNVVLDELMRSAVDGGVGSKRSEIITDTVGTLSSINVRGRLLSRLRKVGCPLLAFRFSDNDMTICRLLVKRRQNPRKL